MSRQLIEDIMVVIENALEDAIAEHAPMNSRHEGKATIEEEFDELWDEIKMKNPDNDKLFIEASHVGAMAARFMLDVCLKKEGAE